MNATERKSPVKFVLILRLGAALLLAGTVVACQQPAQPSGEGKAAAEAAPEAKPGMVLNGGTLMLPIVKGRPGAAYFSLRNGGDQPVTLAGAYIDGAAKAEIHETRGGTMSPVETLDIAPGQTREFARGGLHVMAFDLSDDLSVGGTTEITLTFSDGDKLSAPLEIQSMTGGGAMEGMDHGDMH